MQAGGISKLHNAVQFIVVLVIVPCRGWGDFMQLQTHAFTRLAGSLQELGIYGKLRKVQNCGPMSMFRALLVEWKVSAHCSAVACNTSAGLHRALLLYIGSSAVLMCAGLASRCYGSLRWQF